MMQKVCQMIATYVNILSTYLNYSTTFNHKVKWMHRLSVDIEAEQVKVKRCSCEKSVEMFRERSEKCHISVDLLAIGSWSAHLAHFPSCWNLLQASVKPSSPCTTPWPWQKTVVSWQVDTQNASTRSLVSTGKAGTSPWRHGYLMNSHDISKSLPWPFTCVIICYSMCGNSKKSDICFIFSFM